MARPMTGPSLISSVHLNTERGWRGGELQTLSLVAGLRRRGHIAVLVALPRSKIFERASAEGLDPIGIHAFNEGDPQAIVRLALLLRKLRPGVLHLHTSHAHTLGLLTAPLAPPLRIVVSRRVDFSIYRHSFLRLNWIKYRLRVDRYIAVSRAIGVLLEHEGVSPQRIRVVPSGVDPSRFDETSADREAVLAELGLPRDLPLVVSVGALAPHKGHHTLVEAAAAMLVRRDVAIVIAGEGRLRKKLERLARTRNVAHRVRFLGFREDVGRLVASASVFAFPSLEEGLGTSVLDALVLERPVVASNVGGIPEIIENGTHGLLVPPGDPAALAGALLDLIENPERGRALARAGRERALRAFTMDAMVGGTLRAYEELLSSPAPRWLP